MYIYIYLSLHWTNITSPLPFFFRFLPLPWSLKEKWTSQNHLKMTCQTIVRMLQYLLLLPFPLSLQDKGLQWVTAMR